MAGRFLLQKLSPGMFRSASRLGAHASACARAAAPEGGSTTLSNLFHGAAVRPGTAVTNSRGIQGYAALNRVKPSYTDSVNGAKRTFSSGAFNKLYVFAPATDIEEWSQK